MKRMEIDDIDRSIIKRVSGDLPLTARPFAALARELGLSEQEVVDRLQRLSRGKVMRRFGATLRHQQSGFKANVMVAWNVPPEQAAEVGAKLASFRRVSHCYHRKPCDGFPYNVFSMVHARDKAECEELAAEMAAEVGIDDFALLYSLEELKKTSMRYF